jgi:hypothetical protein
VTFTEPAVGDDPQRRRPDITRARALMDWEPRVPLREGLVRTIAYLRDTMRPARAPQIESRHETARLRLHNSGAGE